MPANALSPAQLRVKLTKLITYFDRGMRLTRPQSGTYGWISARGKNCRACAIGTVLFGAKIQQVKKYNGIFMVSYEYSYRSPQEQVDAMLPGAIFRCPDYGCSNTRLMSVGYVLEHLFENHMWTRPRIEAWLKRQLKSAKFEMDPNLNLEQ